MNDWCYQPNLLPRLLLEIDNLKRRKKLSTNHTTAKYPIHRWFNFIAGYSPEYVSVCIEDANLEAGSTIIDPFAGLSTTLVQASAEGFNAVGFEPHPFFFDISQAKINPPKNIKTIREIHFLLDSLKPYSGNLRNVWEESALIYLRKLVPDKELRTLASALNSEKDLSVHSRPIYRLIISRILELASGAKTDGIYKAPTSTKKSIPFAEAVNQICKMIYDDVFEIQAYPNTQSKLFKKSSESMLEIQSESCNLCVTSPPYLNNFDYAEMTRMELYFWKYATNWSQITENVRRNLIVNTTTTPTDRKDRGDYHHTLSVQVANELKSIVDLLIEKRKQKAGKKDYHTLVFPYFSQMQSIIRELRRVLQPNSYSHWIIGDSALYGVHIETHKILSKIMKNSGFEIINVENLRKRGDRWILSKRQGSTDGLGEFDIVAKRI